MDVKSQKYDRQIRLWGEHGQISLESSKVCLINATAVGTEILKNLVLPSVGSFTIIDGKITTGSDVGNNFFLEPQHIGQPRGKCAANLLGELNEDVSGNYLEEVDPIVLIEGNHGILKQFSLVIATDLAEKHILQLGKICWDNKIPLIIAKCCGLIGYLRVVVPEHTIVESYPDNPIPDIRFDFPLDEIQQMADAIDLQKLKQSEITHIPFILLLFKEAKKWKESHGGNLPKSSSEKEEFRKIITTMQNQYKGENFGEAVANISKVWIPTRIPSDVKDIIQDPKANTIDSNTENFWILVRSLRDFIEDKNEGNRLLPFKGSVIDMHSDTKSYTTIQSIYQSRAKRDLDLIANRVHSYLNQINRHQDSITNEQIKTFCKNAYSLRLIRYRSLDDEYNSPKSSKIIQKLEDPNSPLLFYILFRAADQFYESHKRYPGAIDEFETDVPHLKKCLSSVLQSLEISTNPVSDDLVLEMCRFGGSELHNIAAYIGGVGSQEALKLITHQFVPLNNTFIFNGIVGVASTEEL